MEETISYSQLVEAVASEDSEISGYLDKFRALMIQFPPEMVEN